MGIMGVSSITPAFPRIAQGLSLSSREIGLLLTVFTVPGIVLAPLLGFLADRFGRKTILVPALLLFGVTGAACAVTQSFPMLLGLRFFQGAGAASLTSLSVTLLGDIYTGEDRERAVGYNASALSIGTAAFPLAGGALAALSWQYAFLLPLLALPVGALVLFRLRLPGSDGAGGTGAGRSGRAGAPRSSPLEQVMAVLRNAREQGIIRLSLLAVLVFVLLYGAFLSYVPFLLEGRFSASPPVVGAIMSSMSIATAITAAQRGRVSRRLSTRAALSIATGLYALALVLFPIMPVIWLVPLATLIYGAAQGLTIPTVQSQIAGRAPTELRAATVAANAMAIRIGQTIGPVAGGAVFAAGGTAAVFWFGAVIPLFMLGTIWLGGSARTGAEDTGGASRGNTRTGSVCGGNTGRGSAGSPGAQSE
jgi:predicted MFS family arabinose efflux permease